MPRPAKIWMRGSRGYYATINGRQVSLGHDYTEAQKEFHRLKGQRTPKRRSPRIRDLVELFLSEKADEVKPVTHRRYVCALQSLVDYRKTGQRYYDELRVRDVKEWLRAMPWSANTRQKNAAIVRHWSGWCVDEDDDLADRLSRLRVKGGRSRQAAPPGALEAILKAAESLPALHDFCVILRDTGCRPGELRSLEASSVHWAASEATVSGKTGPRVIGLTDECLAILKRYRLRYPDGPVMRDERGVPWSCWRLCEVWRRIADPLGYVDVILYHFRHALAGRWVAAGVSDMTIASQLGHVKAGRPSTDQTIRTYYHAAESELAKAANQGAGMTSAPGGSPAPSARARAKR